jgi:hypothetical protein
MRHIPLCLVVPFVLACNLTEPEVERLEIRVQGTVTAADDGTPVAGATVGVFGFAGSFGRRDTTTDASGDYSLSFVVSLCSESSKGILVRHPGFDLANIVAISCREGLQIRDIQLERTT